MARLVDVYEAECRAMSQEPGPLFSVTDSVNMLVAEDPDRLWSILGPHLKIGLGTYSRMAAESLAARGRLAHTQQWLNSVRDFTTARTISLRIWMRSWKRRWRRGSVQCWGAFDGRYRH
jgi:hypothetical protein